MKTKIALAVALGALFVAVPGATPKGRPGAGLTLSLTCNEVLAGNPPADSGTDFCSVTASGLPSGAYFLTLSDSCGNFLATNHENPPGFSFGISFSETDIFGCAVTGVTANLFSVSSKGGQTLLASQSAPI